MNNMSPDEIISKIEEIRIARNLPKDTKIKPLSDFEINSLPRIPEGWKWVSINDLSEFITNGVHTPTSFTDDNEYNLRCLRITDLQDNKPINYNSLPYCLRIVSGDYDKKIREGDIYFSFTGNNLGKRYIVKESRDDVVFAHYFVRWRPILINPYYIYYVTYSNVYDWFINANKHGSTQPNLKVVDLKRFPIPLCDLKTQNKIASILKLIDDKIQLNYEVNNNLHELVNSIYLEYVSSLNENNSSKIEIKNVAKCILGGTPSRAKSEYWNGNINWINSGEINKFRIIEASEYITDLGLSKSSTTLLPRETTVLAITGATLGQVSRLEIESCANQSVIGIVPDDSRFNNYIYLTILNNIDDLALRQTGGAQQHINKNDVETFEIIVPNNIEKFDNKVSKIFEKISINCFQNKTLEQLRDTLLPKLMNGEIDLDNIEI